MNKNKLITILWSFIAVFLLGCCMYEYFILPYDLFSLFDEGFFYLSTVFTDPVVSTQPLSLRIEVINACISNPGQYDVLTLRQFAFILKSIMIVCLICCSCLFVYKKYAEKRTHIYLVLISSYLLFGTFLLPSHVINTNDLVMVFVGFAFAICLLYAATSKAIIKYIEVAMVGIVCFLTTLFNLPAGCMMIALCALFMIFYEGFTVRNTIYILLSGLVGLMIGVLITHFCIYSIQDCYDFLQKGIIQTTNSVSESNHSLKRVIFVICFGFRDLTITTLILCGITYICTIIQKVFNKDWIAIVSALILFFIAYKWQVKPGMTIASILCWFTIMFLNYHFTYKELKREEVLLIIFAFIMPIGLVFGTDTSIIVKAISCGIPWGFLVYYLYYLARPEVRKFAIVGMIIIGCCMLSYVDFSYLSSNQEKLHFDNEKPIARMNLTKDQKAFYDEVYGVLSENGFVGERDTLLGFCFNEMTIVAMGAIPYSTDQHPEQFRIHDFDKLPIPKYMIFSEWDSTVLYNRLSELDWDFPNGYNYYKCQNNPDPSSGYEMTQSMIYCRK